MTSAGTRALRSAESKEEPAGVAGTGAGVLVLFDIDGTLLTGDGAGFRAMEEAGTALFGDGFSSDGVTYAGRLDPLIVSDLFELNGLGATPDRVDGFRRAYADALRRQLAVTPVRRLPGALELVEALAATDAAVGVLTGNYEETGVMKLGSAGFDLTVFDVMVWGDDSPHDPPHRDHLPEVALRRFGGASRGGMRELPVVIIGDTPGDAGCAQAGGHACLGVTTGRFDEAALREAGASRVVPGLAETAELAAWVLSHGR